MSKSSTRIARGPLLLLVGLAYASNGHGNCLDHSTYQFGTDTVVRVANYCSHPINVNICTSIQGDFSARRNARQVQGGGSTEFNFFNPDTRQYRYRLRYCETGRTTRADTCPAQCP